MPEKALPAVIPEVLEDQFNRLLDAIPKLSPEELRDVLFQSKQSTLGKAILADLLDAVPIVGDISNVFRVRDAGKVGRERPRRITRQLAAMLVGLLPDPVGGILDLITPSNTVTYLREEMGKR